MVGEERREGKEWEGEGRKEKRGRRKGNRQEKVTEEDG